MPRFRLIVLAGLIGLACASPATPQQRAVPPTAALSQMPAPAQAAAVSGELQPLVHARNAGVVTCLDAVSQAASRAIEAPHAAMSQWVGGAADQGPFMSLIGMAPNNPAAPNAAALLYASPARGGGCTATIVQVFPTARPCAAVQADLSRNGRTVAVLAAMPVVEREAGRYMLLQAPGGGCVIVATGALATAAPVAATSQPVQGPTVPASVPGAPVWR